MENLEIEVTQEKSTFRKEVRVSAPIHAPAGKIWHLLTDAGAYTDWNSTIISLEGTIALGEKIQLRSTLDPKRTFKLKVTRLDKEKQMVWESGAAPMFKGVRTYSLNPKGEASFEFIMAEVFSGIMLPLIAGSLPDFGPVFEQFAKDLKKAAENH